MVSSKEISEMLRAKREDKYHPYDGNNEKIAEKKKCPECETENKKDAKFCVRCGRNFKKTVDIRPDTKICPSCNSKIPENAKFCVVCGETQQDVAEKICFIEEISKIPEPVTEAGKINLPADETPIKLIIRELILNEEGLKFSENSTIEGLNDGNELIKYEYIDNIELKEEEGIITIEIKTDDGSIKINGVDPDSCGKFISKAREMVQKAKPEIYAESMDKIGNAKELLDIGAINEEEFENIKMKILQKY